MQNYEIFCKKSAIFAEFTKKYYFTTLAPLRNALKTNGKSMILGAAWPRMGQMEEFLHFS